MANFGLFKNWIQFGFAVAYNLAQNTSYPGSDSVQMRIYIYKQHEV